MRSFPVVFVTHALLLWAAAPLLAQSFPNFGGVEGRVGAVYPIDADPGMGFSADLDAGFLGIGSLRVLAGLHRFSANRIDPLLADPGSYVATGGRIGLRLDLFGRSSITPYVLGALAGYQVSADVADERTRDLLGGFYAGAAAGAGLAYSLDGAGRIAVTAEGRRTFAGNVDHWALEAGLRIMPRGTRSYLRDRWDSPWTGVAEAERLRLERERQEAERRRIEDERLAGERERLARVAEEERMRAGQQVDRAEEDAARARQELADADLARVQEAAARTRAEAAAATAEAQAEAAARAAREAEQRAREAERRLYDSLLDLERLVASITGIQETERGLSVVVGQGLFASGQGTLSARAREEVGRIAAVLSQFPEHPISVEGHTDSVGSEVSNQRLSEQRAESVRAALIAEGLAPTRVVSSGFGQARPVADNTTAQGRSQNRRVEIVLVGARPPSAQ